ncbi:MAG: glycosyltransferase [Comamonadaceae bacterium]|nr:MAG: glycosyltransferase [Comamonadaceae bacterium]
MNEHKPRLVLDLNAIGRAAESNDAFRACALVFEELKRSDHFDIELVGDTDVAIERADWHADQVEIVLQIAGVELERRKCGASAVRAYVLCDPLSSGSSRELLAWLDIRAVVFAVTPQIKDDLLRLRPGLSSAQITVVPAGAASDSDLSRCVALMTDALLDASRRVRERPASLLWQYPAEAPADIAAPASFLGYGNGASGPAFGATPRERLAAWPLWADMLPPATEDSVRPEGGLRTIGLLKHGSSKNPLVSYVTVVRNNVATLERAIKSVQRQTYPNVEHIVLDGASTDGTVDLILRYASTLDYFVSESDKGLYDAINKATVLARGQLICVLNSDDWLEPHAAEIAVRRMRDRTQGAAFLATGAVIYNLAGTVEVEWPPMFVHPGSYFACANVCHNGVYATRAAYELSGPYDTSYKIAADFKWVMSCVDTGVDFVYTREVTVNYSLGGTSGDAVGHSRECQRVVAQRFPFLSKMEVLGLYDCFFLFARQPHDETGQSKESSTFFLRRLFVQYAGRTDFQRALTWAAMTKLEHPADRPPVATAPPGPIASAQPVAAQTSARRAAKDLAKALLSRYPRLLGLVSSGYGRLRR